MIEIDGGIHNHIDNKEYDKNRSLELEKLGIRVIRFTNEEVNKKLDEVILKIKDYLGPHPFIPSP